MRKKLSHKTHILLFLLCILSLLIPAFYNRFVILGADSASYMYSGIEGFLPVDRPFYYGFFFRHSSLKFSLWLTLISQAIIVFYTLFLFNKYLFGLSTKINLIFVFCFLLCANFFSGLPILASSISADVFSGLVFLSSVLVLSGKLLLHERIIISLIFLLSVSVHFSHVPIAIATMFIYAFFEFVKQKEDRKQISLLFISYAFAATFIIQSLNFMIFQKFVYSQISNVFITGRFAENGYLKEYLNNDCKKAPEFICKNKDKFPMEGIIFVWYYDNIVYQDCDVNSDGSENSFIYNCLRKRNDELKPLVKDMLLNKKFISYAITDTKNQLMEMDLNAAWATSAGVIRNENIKHVEFTFPEDLPSLLGSKQFNEGVDVYFINTLQKYVVLISLLILILL